MNHKIVLANDYAKQKRWRRRTNTHPLLAILMAMVRRWSNTCGITRCSMFRATPEATGCRHRATTAWATANKTIMWYVPTLMVILMAIGMWRHYRAHRPNGGGLGLSYKPLNTAIGQELAPIASIRHTNASCFFDHFIVKKCSSWHVAP